MGWDDVEEWRDRQTDICMHRTDSHGRPDTDKPAGRGEGEWACQLKHMHATGCILKIRTWRASPQARHCIIPLDQGLFGIGIGIGNSTVHKSCRLAIISWVTCPSSW